MGGWKRFHTAGPSSSNHAIRNKKNHGGRGGGWGGGDRRTERTRSTARKGKISSVTKNRLEVGGAGNQEKRKGKFFNHISPGVTPFHPDFRRPAAGGQKETEEIRIVLLPMERQSAEGRKADLRRNPVHRAA